MNRNDLVLGGIALVVGVLLGLLFAPRGASLDDIKSVLDERLAGVESAASGTGDSIAALQAKVGENVSSLQSQVEESIAALQTQVGSVGERLGAVETALGETASRQATNAEDLKSDISGRLESIGTALSDQSSKFQSRMEDLRQSLTGSGAAGDAGQPANDEGGEDGGQGAEQSSAPVTTPEIADFVGIGPGQTATFGDGAVRAFVSRVDAENGEVRLSINGETQTMTAGQTMGVEGPDGTFCRLMVSGIQAGQVALNGSCGEDMQEPEGTTVGGSVELADGAVRVFVSRVADDGGSARIAVNGVDTQTLKVGGSAEVAVEDGTCEVTVDGIDRGHVALSASCD